MKIAFAHFRANETDGVSLEMEKWASVLTKLGHVCYYIVGSGINTNTFIIDEMHYQSKLNEKIVNNAYRSLKDYSNEFALNDEIFKVALLIENKLTNIIIDNNIDLVIVNNIWSLGWNLPTGIAFTNVARKLNYVKFIAHNHDFYFERVLYSKTTCKCVSDILENYFIPINDNIKHVVINNIAYDELIKRKNIISTIIPNVFNFDMTPFEIDDYNKDLKKDLGIKEGDLVILQSTRISERKAIELGIDCVREISNLIKNYYGEKTYKNTIFTKDSKVYYVFCGMVESVNENYYTLLKDKMKNYNINFIDINNITRHSRSDVNGMKMYSFWDAYTISDLITYTSILEGWGNQLLEAVFAKKPVILFEYPVYVKSIKEYSFDVFSLGNKYKQGEDGLVNVSKNITHRVSSNALHTLFSQKEYNRIVNKNYDIGKNNFSYLNLEDLLINLLK